MPGGLGRATGPAATNRCAFPDELAKGDECTDYVWVIPGARQIEGCLQGGLGPWHHRRRAIASEIDFLDASGEIVGAIADRLVLRDLPAPLRALVRDELIELVGEARGLIVPEIDELLRGLLREIVLLEDFACGSDDLRGEFFTFGDGEGFVLLGRASRSLGLLLPLQCWASSPMSSNPKVGSELASSPSTYLPEFGPRSNCPAALPESRLVLSRCVRRSLFSLIARTY